MFVCYPPWGTGLNPWTTLSQRALGLGDPQQAEPWAGSRVWALLCGWSREESWAERPTERLGLAQGKFLGWHSCSLTHGTDLLTKKQTQYPQVMFCNTTQSSALHLSSLSHGSYFCHQQSSGCLWPTAALHPALPFHSNRGEAQNPKERKMGKLGYPLLETMNIHYNYYL